MKRSADDVFSMGGDENSGFMSKWYFVDEDANMVCNVDEQGYEPFTCGIDGCTEEFFSEKEFRRHCRKFHRHICSICRENFSTDKLLSMHLMEKHDNYFKEQAKIQPMYQCFATDCNCVFFTPEEREAHAVQTHSFSVNSTLVRLFRRDHLSPNNSTSMQSVVLYAIDHLID